MGEETCFSPNNHENRYFNQKKSSFDYLQSVAFIKLFEFVLTKFFNSKN
jgi:hypothetical protein